MSKREFFFSEPVTFRRVYGLESYSRTSGESNHHRQSVSDVKNDAIPTEPRGRLSKRECSSSSTSRLFLYTGLRVFIQSMFQFNIVLFKPDVLIDIPCRPHHTGCDCHGSGFERSLPRREDKTRLCESLDRKSQEGNSQRCRKGFFFRPTPSWLPPGRSTCLRACCIGINC